MSTIPAHKKRIAVGSKFARAIDDPNDPIIGSYKQSVIMGEIKRLQGNLNAAAKSLKISRKTLDKYVSKSKVLQELCKEIFEEEIDQVEKALHNQIDKGNLTAILFYLKCKGRERGWIEKTDLNVDLTKPITFKYTLANGKGRRGKSDRESG